MRVNNIKNFLAGLMLYLAISFTYGTDQEIQMNLTKYAETLFECSLGCSSVYSCKSFSFIQSNEECILYPYFLNPDTQGLNSPAWKYYEDTTTSNRHENSWLYKVRNFDAETQNTYTTESSQTETTTVTEPSGCANPDYTLVESLGICYKIFVQTENKYDADNICQLDGGYLITLDTLEKNIHMVNAIPSVPVAYSYWIGASDAINEGIWIWRNVVNVLHTFWGFAVSQPNNYDGAYNDGRQFNADCACLMQGGGWDDQNCDKRHGFICEIQI